NKSPLNEAVIGGNVENAAILLEYGATDYKSATGYTAMETAKLLLTEEQVYRIFGESSNEENIGSQTNNNSANVLSLELPTRTGRIKSTWINAIPSDISYGINTGKWILNRSSENVDECWLQVKQAVENNYLWRAKVSTNNGTNKYVIIIYTKDYN